MKKHVLNLGAGVQSTTLYMLSHEGKLPCDVAIFADTQEEAKPVYDHLAWLQSLGTPPLWIRSVGKLGQHLIEGGARSKRSATIPAFCWDGKSKQPNGKPDPRILEWHCSHEYKGRLIRQTIRRELLGYTGDRRIGKLCGISVTSYFGISTDEYARAERIRRNMDGHHWYKPAFPLLDMGWSRKDCIKYLADKVPHPTPRSACVFCPFRTRDQWQWLKDNDPAGFARAVEVDQQLRQIPNAVAGGNRVKGALYLHRQCVPLDQVDLTKPAETLDLFSTVECSGACGV